MKLVLQLDGKSIRGNEKQMILLAASLRARGHHVIACCRAGGVIEKALLQHDVRVSDVRPSGDLALLSAARFARWLRSERPDAILVTSWRKSLVAGWAATAAGVPRRVLRVGGVHTPRRAMDRWKYRRALTRYYDAIIVNSRTVAGHLLATIEGLPDETIVTIPNGIAGDRPSPSRLRQELAIDQNHTLVIGVGGLDVGKGFDVLIRAAALLEDSIHVAIAGEGPERHSLTTLATSLGLGRRVHLLGNRSDVPDLVAVSDVYVSSSHREGMSVAMLEAMAAGTPVISTDVGGVWEALGAHDDRPECGWVVPSGDHVALSIAIQELTRGKREVIETLVAEARWRASNWFGADAMIDRYEEALGTRGREAPRDPSATSYTAT